MCLYVMLTGIPPFVGRNHEEIERAICEAELRFPDNPKVSSELRAIIAGLLTKDPQKRASIESVAESRWFIEKVRGFNGQLDDDSDQTISSRTIELTRQLGFPMEVIKETIERRRQDHINACVNLLK